ncbi:MAG: lipoyl(octanoyl) transferase LipB [Muribaculaceae bacterium]|nr:lipoyl(octanoyl) transferase LipB [Muribaculaceae bacterium]
MIKIYQPQGPQRYEEILVMQRQLFDEMVAEKRATGRVNDEHLISVEHLPVITLGRRAHHENLLISEDMLKARNIDVFRIERGGDITYHGPGQIVMYPLIDLEHYHLGVKDYVNLLEEAVILTLKYYGIEGERVEGATGVWIDKDTPHERKICAIGVKCSRFITMHGLALNVNTELSPFTLINPCGFVDKGVTSIAKELNHPVDYAEATHQLRHNFLTLLNSHT